MKTGDKVTYVPEFGESQKGIVKELRGDSAFIVYHCDSNWHRYFDYTGEKTYIKDLQLGWTEDN